MCFNTSLARETAALRRSTTFMRIPIMAKVNVTLSLDLEALVHLDKVAPNNRSDYTNKLILKDKSQSEVSDGSPKE